MRLSAEGASPITIDVDTDVGRAESATVVLDDVQVSRRHALIRRHEGDWVVIDLRFTNGTWLNGIRLPPGSGSIALQTGDTLAFGKKAGLFRVLIEPAHG